MLKHLRRDLRQIFNMCVAEVYLRRNPAACCLLPRLQTCSAPGYDNGSGAAAVFSFGYLGTAGLIVGVAHLNRPVIVDRPSFPLKIANDVSGNGCR